MIELRKELSCEYEEGVSYNEESILGIYFDVFKE